MAISKKSRFTRENVDIILENPAIPFPPEKIVYEEQKLVLLGRSNKDDLLPVNIDTDGLRIASLSGKLGQFIYSAENADLYDAFLYVNEYEEVVLKSIRTRLV